MCLIFYPFLILFHFFTFPFLMFFNFYIIKKLHVKNFSRHTTDRLATHQWAATHEFMKRCIRQYLGSEILTAVFIKSSVFWDKTQCSPSLRLKTKPKK
jgi:hypothetical protein